MKGPNENVRSTKCYIFGKFNWRRHQGDIWVILEYKSSK